MLSINNPIGPHSYRDERSTTFGGFGGIFPDKTINDASYMSPMFAPTLALSNTFTSDPDTSAEYIAISLFAKNDSACRAYVNELDLIFCNSRDTELVSGRRSRSRVDISRISGNTSYYAATATGGTGVGPVTCYSIQAANKALAEYQIQELKQSGAPLAQYKSALFIDNLPTVQEIYNRALPMGIVGRENPMGSIASNSGTYNYGGYHPALHTDQEGKLISCVTSGSQPIKNLWGRHAIGASLGIALVPVDVPLSYDTYYTPLSTGAAPSTAIHARDDIGSVNLTRTSFYDSPCGVVRKYKNDTTLGRVRKPHPGNTSEPSTYIFQWVPYVEDNYSTKAALLRQTLPVVRQKTSPGRRGPIDPVEYVGPYQDSVLAGIARHIGTSVHARRGTDDNNFQIHRNYDAVDATDVLVFHAEMGSPGGITLFELDTRSATRRLKQHASDDAFL